MTVGIYCRLSREDEGPGESESIQNQRALLLDHAAREGWTVRDVYCDEDYSGADRDRPDFRRLLADAERGCLDIVLVKTQSRFTRDMELFERYVHGLFPIWGVRFIALVDHVDTANAGGKKARQISGLVNEWYLEDLSASIRAVLDHKRRSGDYIGSFALYGYVKSKEDRHQLVKDPEAAKVVQTIFSLYLQGMGKSRIARELNLAGIPNPTRYKQLCGMNYVNKNGGGLWSRTTVGRILRERMYTGDMVQGRRKKASYKTKTLLEVPREEWIVVPDTHEAIIDRETFARVQALLGERTRSDGRGEVHPLAGLVRCGRCGGAMTKVSTTYRGERRSYLRCSARQRGLCPGVSVRLDALEDCLLEGILRQLRHFGDMVYIKKELEAEGGEGSRTAAAGLRRELERLDRALRTLYLDRADGTVTPQQYRAWSLEYEGQKRETEKRLARLETEDGGEVALSEPKTLSRALALRFIRRVTVGERVGAEQVIDVEWLT